MTPLVTRTEEHAAASAVGEDLDKAPALDAGNLQDSDFLDLMRRASEVTEERFPSVIFGIVGWRTRPLLLRTATIPYHLVLVPKLTKDPWFGPKLSGFGLSPVSWQGWLATVVFLALFIGAAVLLRGVVGRAVAWIVLLAAFGALLLLTGTRPGGPGLGGPRR